jgi:hypothetical protein
MVSLPSRRSSQRKVEQLAQPQAQPGSVRSIAACGMAHPLLVHPQQAYPQGAFRVLQWLGVRRIHAAAIPPSDRSR